MDIKKQLVYNQPLVNIITIHAGYVVCNSSVPNAIANVDEDEYGPY